MDSTAVMPDTTGAAAALVAFLTTWVLAAPSAAGVVKVAAFLKWLFETKFSIKITKWSERWGSYTGWVFVFLVALGWTLAAHAFQHVPITGEVFREAVMVGWVAISLYGAALMGFFGTAGKNLATKPVI